MLTKEKKKHSSALSKHSHCSLIEILSREKYIVALSDKHWYIYKPALLEVPPIISAKTEKKCKLKFYREK